MKLASVLFSRPWRAYQVLGDDWDRSDDFTEWDLHPLAAPTLAAEDVDDAFQGLFIIAAQLVTSGAKPEPCYLDVVLPERIVEHHFIQTAGGIVRGKGRRLLNGTVIPAIGIEAPGIYKLYYAKEDPSVGIETLRTALREGRRKQDMAFDLGLLLRDEKRYEEAVEAFSVSLAENDTGELAAAVYKERAKMYAALGQVDRSEQDRQKFATIFEKMYGHAPGLDEL